MAYPDRLGGFAGQQGKPEQRGVLTDVQKFGPPTEAGGFRGVLAGKIAEWSERGLGRAIGFMVPPETSYDRPRFHGVLFALPLTDLTNRSIPDEDHRVLLLAPQQADVRFFVVKPKQIPSSYYENSHESQKATIINLNKNLALGFRQFFQPGTAPSTDVPWKHNPSQALGDFYRNPELLTQSVEVDVELQLLGKQEFLERALEVARKMEVARKAASETILVETLGEEVAAEFGKHERDFRREIYTEEVREARRRALAESENDMGNEGALLSRLGDDVVDSLTAVSHEFDVSLAARKAADREMRRGVFGMSDEAVYNEANDIFALSAVDPRSADH